VARSTRQETDTPEWRLIDSALSLYAVYLPYENLFVCVLK